MEAAMLEVSARAPRERLCAFVDQVVRPLPPKRQPLRHLPDEAGKPVAHLNRRHLECEHSLHQRLLQTMTADADTVRGEQRGPFNQLTKS